MLLLSQLWFRCCLSKVFVDLIIVWLRANANSLTTRFFIVSDVILAGVDIIRQVGGWLCQKLLEPRVLLILPTALNGWLQVVQTKHFSVSQPTPSSAIDRQRNDDDDEDDDSKDCPNPHVTRLLGGGCGRRSKDKKRLGQLAVFTRPTFLTDADIFSKHIITVSLVGAVPIRTPVIVGWYRRDSSARLLTRYILIGRSSVGRIVIDWSFIRRGVVWWRLTWNSFVYRWLIWEGLVW